MVGWPCQVPSETLSVSPRLTVPVIVGGAVFDGAPEPTTVGGVEVALADPKVLVAVTVTSTLCPESELCSAYVELVAPAIGA